MSHQHSSHTGRGLQVALAAAVLYGCSGCAAVNHHLHQHGPAALTGDHHASYYHCPECGRIEPKSKHHVCGPRVVLPFFGHQPTCWRPWPAGWIGCPPCTEPVETILYDQPLVIPAEVIPPPPPPTIDRASAERAAVERAAVEGAAVEGDAAGVGTAELRLAELELSMLRSLTAGAGQPAPHPAPVVQIATPLGWDVAQ